MNTWAFRAPRLFQPWRILAAFHSPAPLAQRKLLTPSGVGYRNKTQTLTCPLNRGKSSLRLGDFQAGNQIVLSIEGGGSVQSDTLTVESGPLIDVPTLGPILLHGVLRSELETHLATEIGRFIQTPRIQARALIRVSVAGAVGQPGFYALPTDLRLSDAVTLAGGPAGGADPGQIRVERGTDELWSFEELLAPVAEGRTLDDLGLQPGDRIILRGGNASVVQSPFLQRVIQNSPFILVSVLLGRTIR